MADAPREEHDRELDEWRETHDRDRVLADFSAERERQLAKWGPQTHPDGTNQAGDVDAANRYRDLCDRRAQLGKGTWRDILLEETFEAIAESNPVRLRKELVQSGAVITAWIEDIDTRG